MANCGDGISFVGACPNGTDLLNALPGSPSSTQNKALTDRPIEYLLTSMHQDPTDVQCCVHVKCDGTGFCANTYKGCYGGVFVKYVLSNPNAKVSGLKCVLGTNALVPAMCSVAFTIE